jgi:hypothetical protein
MAYTEIDNSGEHFNTVLWTGNGNNNRTITDVGFQPDWVWSKCTSHSVDHGLQDSVRGIGKVFHTNSTSVEGTDNWITGLNSNGFTLSNSNEVNQDGRTFVAWNWKAGTSFSNDASSTSVGSIDSVGSVNTDAGFSIISYTSTGSNGTIAHGLGAVPQMIIFKRRSGDTENWPIYHHKLGNTHYRLLNATDAAADSNTRFNDTSPTSTVFSVGTSGDTNGGTSPFIAYCFAEKKGYSKFGNYLGTGNDGDGPYIFTGFKPAFVLLMESTSTGSPCLFDSKRAGRNPNNYRVYPNNSNAHDTSEVIFDFYANGFKIRGDQSDTNASGQTYIFMAIAEAPFVNSKGVPVNAR